MNGERGSVYRSIQYHSLDSRNIPIRSGKGLDSTMVSSA